MVIVDILSQILTLFYTISSEQLVRLLTKPFKLSVPLWLYCCILRDEKNQQSVASIMHIKKDDDSNKNLKEQKRKSENYLHSTVNFVTFTV